MFEVQVRHTCGGGGGGGGRNKTDSLARSHNTNIVYICVCACVSASDCQAESTHRSLAANDSLDLEDASSDDLRRETDEVQAGS